MRIHRIGARLTASLRQHGLSGTLGTLAVRARGLYALVRYRAAAEHRNPTLAQYGEIDDALARAGIRCEPLLLSTSAYAQFADSFAFPADYHGGKAGGVWHEKIFEHFVAYTLCGLPAFRRDTDVYLDIAAGGSPWAVLLRDAGYQATALDLKVADAFRDRTYYVTADATRMPFPTGGVRALSLQCAFEMFVGDSDRRFVDECARVLAPGGCAVIVPLYLQTRYCGYATPEYYGRRGYADPGAAVCMCRHYWGIPFARFYDVAQLERRVLERASAAGLQYRLFNLKKA